MLTIRCLFAIRQMLLLLTCFVRWLVQYQIPVYHNRRRRNGCEHSLYPDGGTEGHAPPGMRGCLAAAPWPSPMDGCTSAKPFKLRSARMFYETLFLRAGLDLPSAACPPSQSSRGPGVADGGCLKMIGSIDEALE